ncbi:uncharacterized protein LOC113020024 isoform X2 [Astatotilapia calliptera]|nr:uncharacterized protein LOC113020024 isoform X2 [Astatotilapia calliptera]
MFWGYVLVIVTVAVVLIVTTFIAVRRLNKKQMRSPVESGEKESQNTGRVSRLSMCDDNQPQHQDQSEGETTEIVYAAVYFHNKRKPNAEQQKNTQSEDVIYSTVCRPVCAALNHPQNRQEAAGPIYASPKRKQPPYTEEGACLLKGSKF